MKTVVRDNEADPPPWMLTLRLALHDITRYHANELYELDSDPRVMRYIGDGEVETREAAQAAIERTQRRYCEHPGLGAWRVSRRDNGGFVGWVSLKHAGESPDIEVGYRLRADAWGQGFATELARAMIRRGFDDCGLARIIGVTHPDNAASQRVLLKAGLRDEGWGDYYERRLRLFAISREQQAAT